MARYHCNHSVFKILYFRGGEVWYLVRLITSSKRVQNPLPQHEFRERRRSSVVERGLPAGRQGLSPPH